MYLQRRAIRMDGSGVPTAFLGSTSTNVSDFFECSRHSIGRTTLRIRPHVRLRHGDPDAFVEGSFVKTCTAVVALAVDSNRLLKSPPPRRTPLKNVPVKAEVPTLGRSPRAQGGCNSQTLDGCSFKDWDWVPDTQAKGISVKSLNLQQPAARPGQVASQKLHLTKKEQFFIEKQRNASEDQRKSAPWLFGKFCVRLEQIELSECRTLLLFEILYLKECPRCPPEKDRFLPRSCSVLPGCTSVAPTGS